MHAVYIGVVKDLTTRMVSGPASFACHIDPEKRKAINDLLPKIKPPHRVSRPLKSLDDMPNWKAHEWSMWLFYYSVPVLEGLLPHACFQHWGNLVYGISLLVGSRVTPDEIEVARRNLESFCLEVKDWYGERSLNVHLLRHFPEFVKMWGPLPSFAMYPFESFNHDMAGYVKGSQHVAQQICKAYGRAAMTKLRAGIQEGTSEDLTEYDMLLSWELSDYDVPEECINRDLVLRPGTFYQVCIRKGVKFTCKEYRKGQNAKRNSSYVSTRRQTAGQILAFWELENNSEVLAILREVELYHPFGLEHVWRRRITERTRVVQMTEIYEPMIFIETKTSSYYITFLNATENVAS